MTSTATLYTTDRRWNVVVAAFKTSWLGYSAIGTRVTAYHWEPARSWHGLTRWHWVERPVAQIAITNSYSGTLGGGMLSAAASSASAEGVARLQERRWAIGPALLLRAPVLTCSPCLVSSPTLAVNALSSFVSVSVAGELLHASVAI